MNIPLVLYFIRDAKYSPSNSIISSVFLNLEFYKEEFFFYKFFVYSGIQFLQERKDKFLFISLYSIYHFQNNELVP